ncbi:MAG: hypothetical protein Mars2KO_05380 [Maribacter sp.]
MRGTWKENHWIFFVKLLLFPYSYLTDFDFFTMKKIPINGDFFYSANGVNSLRIQTMVIEKYAREALRKH